MRDNPRAGLQRQLDLDQEERPCPRNVLLVGESWVSAATHYKGFDQFGSVTFHLGAEPLVEALEGSEFELTYMPAHEAAEKFPFEMAGLAPTTPSSCPTSAPIRCCCRRDVWLQSRTVPNRLKLIRAWVAAGGGLLMVGGYFSLPGHRRQGALAAHAGRGRAAGDVPALRRPRRDARGHRRRTASSRTIRSSPGLGGDWPPLLGVNEVERAKRATSRCWPGCRRTRAAIRCSSSARYGKGRTAAWTRTSGRTGCRRRSANGRATAGCGRTSSAG